MQTRTILVAVAAMLLSAVAANADVFGIGGNQFTIDFVPIPGSPNPDSGIPAGDSFAFTGVANDYRMGVYEITNDQWGKFKAGLGVPLTGSPASAYRNNPDLTVPQMPVSDVSWYEAAQFVNWLNTSTGHPAAYSFTGTQGTSDYTLEWHNWRKKDTSGASLYRNEGAFYYLPTEDEWLKAAYWNGTTLQAHATKAGELLTQGDGTSGTGWNYLDATTGYVMSPPGPWAVGSGSEELNGTHDMMGNVLEWTESPYNDTGIDNDCLIALRGGSFVSLAKDCLASPSARYYHEPDTGPFDVYYGMGFRVASIPEPATLSLLALGGLTILKRRK